MRHALMADASVVFRGPVARRASAVQRGGGAATATATATTAVQIEFDLQAGAGGLHLDTAAACPSVVLNVYCRRATTLGFEIEVLPGVWQAPARVSLSPDGSGVLATMPSGAASHPLRVRYAYSDWPVVSLRNKEGGLPARVFDIAVA